MRVQGRPAERSYSPGVLRRAFLAVVVAHALVAVVLAALPFDDAWAEDLGVAERLVGGGLWLFAFLAMPVVVVTFVAWAIVAWHANSRQLAGGWAAALGIGWLAAIPLAGEGGDWEPVVLVAAGCGQLGAWLLRRFAFRFQAPDTSPA